MLNPFDFKYTHAVVSRVPNSLKEATYTRRKDPLTGVFRADTADLDKAVEQHNEYILTLRKLGIDVIELQADDTLPDSTFVDCMAVICNGTALIARPHLVSRRREADVIKSVLKKEGLHVVEIKDPIATIDASDVFFTGREFFVGLSKRTNIVGAKAVASAFPEYPVAMIKMRKGGFHLKAYVAVAGPDLLAIGSSEAAKDILRQMKEIAEYKKYQVITIPDMHGVNCLYVNNSLIHCSRDELFNSAKVFAYKIDYPRIELKNREFAKLDRFYTCRSLLFTKNKIYSIVLSKYYTKLVSISPTPALVAAIQEQENEEKKQQQQQQQPQQHQPQAVVTAGLGVAAVVTNLNITVNNNNTNNNHATTTTTITKTAAAIAAVTTVNEPKVIKKANFNFNNNNTNLFRNSITNSNNNNNTYDNNHHIENDEDDDDDDEHHYQNHDENKPSQDKKGYRIDL